VLGVALGVAALLLYLDSTTTNVSGASITILFGSMFVLGPSSVPPMIAFGAAALAVVLLNYRMLLLSSLNGDLAAARGVPVRLVGMAYFFSLAIAVALSAMTIGAVLSTALLIGPPAAALRIARRPGAAMLLSVAIAVVATWGGILAAYDSFYWPPAGRGWPVSFLVVVAIFIAYVLARVVTLRRPQHRVQLFSEPSSKLGRR